MQWFNVIGPPLLVLICLGISIYTNTNRTKTPPFQRPHHEQRSSSESKQKPRSSFTGIVLDTVPVDGQVSNYLDCEAVDPEGTRWLSRMGVWRRDPRFIRY